MSHPWPLTLRGEVLSRTLQLLPLTLFCFHDIVAFLFPLPRRRIPGQRERNRLRKELCPSSTDAAEALRVHATYFQSAGKGGREGGKPVCRWLHAIHFFQIAWYAAVLQVSIGVAWRFQGGRHTRRSHVVEGYGGGIPGSLAGPLYSLCNGEVITSAVSIFMHSTFSVCLHNIRGGRERHATSR